MAKEKKEEQKGKGGELVQRNNSSPIPHQNLVDPVEAVKEQVKMIERLYKEVLVKDVHYGTIPNTNKPTLLKAGAEKIVEMFQLCPEVETKKEWLENGHMNVDATVKLLNRNGNFIASGTGSCSTLESKYRYRLSDGEVIGVVPKEYWNTHDMSLLKGGVPKKIDGLWRIVKNQEKKENPNIADQYNTVLKMAVKRALVASTLMLGASDIFTQDTEDVSANERVIEGTATTEPQKSPQGHATEPPRPTTPPSSSTPATGQENGVGSEPATGQGARKPMHINKIGLNEVIGFGKFKSETFLSVPSWWLEWLYQNIEQEQKAQVLEIINFRIRESVEQKIEKLGGNDSDLQRIIEKDFQVQKWGDLSYEQKKSVLEYLDKELANEGKK